MKRWLTLVSLVGLCSIVGCDDEKRAITQSDCDSGYVLTDGRCEKLCTTFDDCAVGQACDPSGLCVATTQQPPQILRLDGDSTLATSDPTHAPHHIQAGLVIEGENLADVVVALDGEAAGLPSFDALTVRAGGSANRIEVTLPPTVPPGTYTLVVTNAAGSDQATATLLQGPPGVTGDAGLDGACDPTACTTQALPGVGSIVTLRVQALDRAVVAQPLSLQIDGVEQIPGTAAAETVWLAVVDRFTGVLSTTAGHNQAYDASGDPTAMIQALQAVTETQAAAMVTSANGYDQFMFTDPGIGSTIEAELLLLGATDLISGTGAQHQMAFVGYRGVVPAGGIFLAEENVSAETTVMFADGVPIGGTSADRFGKRIDGDEIRAGAVDHFKLAVDAVTMVKIADGAVWTNKLNDLAVTNAKLADDAVQTRNIQADAVDTVAIADSAVTAAKLNLPLASYSATSAATAGACSTAAPHTFCALSKEDHRFYVAGTGTHVWCQVIVGSSGWQVCARGDGTTEATCEMICF